MGVGRGPESHSTVLSITARYIFLKHQHNWISLWRQAASDRKLLKTFAITMGSHFGHRPSLRCAPLPQDGMVVTGALREVQWRCGQFESCQEWCLALGFWYRETLWKGSLGPVSQAKMPDQVSGCQPSFVGGSS